MSGGLQLIPVGETDGVASIKKLGDNFSIDTKIVDHLLKSGLANLEEFRFFWDAEDKVDVWLQKIGVSTDDRNLQGARVRRAWAAVRLYFQQAEQDRSKVSTADLDSMLQESELRDVKASFWARYRLRLPAEVHPADATLSRVSREMSKRMLCVHAVWKVKSLQHQLHTTNRKRKLAEGLFTEEQEDEEHGVQDWEGYLDKLQTLMIAYSIAGSTGVTGSPPAADEATLGSDSTKFVHAPLDIMLNYYMRAKRTACMLPHSKRLSWLSARDAEERAEWVARFRESTMTLGQVVKEVSIARDAHWIPSLAVVQAEVAYTPAPANPLTKAPVGQNHWALGKPIAGKPVAKVLKDGTKLCQAFQHGSCRSKAPCGQGQHRCALVIKKERVCGASGHGAATCKTTPRVS